MEIEIIQSRNMNEKKKHFLNKLLKFLSSHAQCCQSLIVLKYAVWVLLEGTHGYPCHDHIIIIMNDLMAFNRKTSGFLQKVACLT